MNADLSALTARATVKGVRKLVRRSPEKQEEAAAMKLMAVLGFTAWHLSQARASRQTSGWPDVFFTHPDKRLSVYYEAKSLAGRQSPAQREFQKHVTACGHAYVVGPCSALTLWCVERGLCKVTAGGGIEVIR